MFSVAVSTLAPGDMSAREGTMIDLLRAMWDSQATDVLVITGDVTPERPRVRFQFTADVPNGDKAVALAAEATARAYSATGREYGTLSIGEASPLDLTS